MKTITIVGAGQAGLQLALGLQRHGYDVTLVSDRTPDQIHQGTAKGAATLFGRSLALEASLGQNDWADAVTTPHAEFNLYTPQGALPIRGTVEPAWLTVDQRLKHAHWLDRFSALGGQVIIEAASIPVLERYAQRSDLVVVAAGARPFGQLFQRNPSLSPFDRPQRHLLQVFVSGVQPWYEAGHGRTTISIFPGLGEIFMLPFYTKEREQGHVVLIEAVPGGAFDFGRTVQTGPDALAVALAVLRQALPTYCPFVRRAELADENAWLQGAITPVVRHPVGYLPSGAPVLGIGDVTVLNDPIAGQGANSATKFAHLLLARILERTSQGCDEGFDAHWMMRVFAEFWRYAQHVNALSRAMLLPPSAHQQRILMKASQHPALALDFINGFDHPPALFPWFTDPEAGARHLAERGVGGLVPALA